MTFSVVMVFMLVAPIAAVFVSVRNQQLMAPAVGAIDTSTRLRGESKLRGAAVSLRLLWPLVRIESVRLVRHPAIYLIAAPFTLLSLSAFNYSEIAILGRDDASLAVLLAPYGWGVLIASNLLTLRSRRFRSEELLATTPVPQRSRTAAHLLATLATLPGAIVLLAAWFALAALSGRAIGTARPAAVATGLLLVVGGGCVGVAVARWLPRPLFGWVAVIVTIILQVNFGALDPRWRWLHFSMYAGETVNYPALAPEHHLAHLVYLAGGILLVAAVALARDGLDRRTGSLGLAAIAILVVFGTVQTLPIADADAELFARRLEEPAPWQSCHDAAGYTICADDPGSEHYLGWWRDPVDGVLRRVPATALPSGLVIRQRALIDVRALLHTEIAARVDPARVWADDDEVSVSERWALPAQMDDRDPARHQLALAFRTASAVVGLPPDAWWSAPSLGTTDWVTVPLALNDEYATPVLGPLVQCFAADDGRAVVAVWLAGQSSPAARVELIRRAGEVLARDEPDAPVVFDPVVNYLIGMPNQLPEQGAVPSGAEVLAAAALLGLDDDAVAVTLEQHWDELTRPGGVSTATVLGWFGTDPDRARDEVMATAPRYDLAEEHDGPPQAPALTGTCPTVGG